MGEYKGLWMYTRGYGCIQGAMDVYKGLWVNTRGYGCIQGAMGEYKGLSIVTFTFNQFVILLGPLLWLISKGIKCRRKHISEIL